MPYLENSDQTDVSKDSVSDENEPQMEEDEEIEDPPEPRRSTRSTGGQPAESYGKVSTFCASI